MWCACADAVRDTVGKCGSKPHWGSARFTPCDTPRSYRLRRPHRAAAPALAVAPSPQPVKTWRPIVLSREIVHTRLLHVNEPSTVVFGARRAVLCAGRARSAPPPARRARGPHPADGHGHAVYNIYHRLGTESQTASTVHSSSPPSCARCRCSARDTRTCKHRPVDLRFTTLIRLQKVLLRRVEENSLFLRVGRQRWKLDEKVVPRLWCQEPSTAIAVTALAHCDVCAPESWCELIRAVRSVRG